LSWSQTGERKIFGPDLVIEAEEKVRVIQENLRVAQSRQKSYFDKRRKPLQFEVGDHVYLRHSQTKGVQRFGVRGRLAPRYVGPMAYRVRLPPPLAAIHDIFYVSQLKKCIQVVTEIVEQKEILVEPDLSYVEYPIKVLDQKERVTRRKVVKMYKIQWSHYTEEEATWETESYLNQNFRGFLNSPKGTRTFHTKLFT
jgi:hypothetical protein